MTGEISQLPSMLANWTLDWSKDLGGETIVASSWTVSSPQVTLSNPSETATTTTIWITGGIANNTYIITNTITTSGGQVLAYEVPYVCLAYRYVD